MSLDRSKSERRTTIYDLAELAGTSASTVSSVLSGDWKKRRISERMASKIQNLATENGYSINMQASALRTERSGIVGMLVPMYNNRYFSSIAQSFEHKARERNLFPIVTCTLRDPELEEKAARQMFNYRVDHLVCTGATDPDRISVLCDAYGVKVTNLDLPGSKAPSIVSDNYTGAYSLTQEILGDLKPTAESDKKEILFVGGRASDHSTKERIRGFRSANKNAGIKVQKSNILANGYAAEKAELSMNKYVDSCGSLPQGIFVNSTISLEGVVNWFSQNATENLDNISLGCFDWDPFVALLNRRIVMVKQDVPEMMKLLFDLIDGQNIETNALIKIPSKIIKNLDIT